MTWIDISKHELKNEFIDFEFKGETYNIERFYYESLDGQEYTTTEFDSDFFNRLEQLHRDRKIYDILKKN